MQQFLYNKILAVYGDGAYSRSVYGDAAGSGSGGLANTGLWIAVAVTAACLLIFTALLVRFWRRKKAVPPSDVPPSE